jgi:ferritin heavy chain
MLQILCLQMPLNESWESGLDALKDALKLEAHVTRKIRDIIIACENPTDDGKGFNDYHVCFIIQYITFNVHHS